MHVIMCLPLFPPVNMNSSLLIINKILFIINLDLNLLIINKREEILTSLTLQEYL